MINFFSVFKDGIKNNTIWISLENGSFFVQESILHPVYVWKHNTEKGDGIIMHTPAYGPLQNSILKNNRKMLSSPLKKKWGTL